MWGHSWFRLPMYARSGSRSYTAKRRRSRLENSSRLIAFTFGEVKAHLLWAFTEQMLSSCKSMATGDRCLKTGLCYDSMAFTSVRWCTGDRDLMWTPTIIQFMRWSGTDTSSSEAMVLQFPFTLTRPQKGSYPNTHKPFINNPVCLMLRKWHL